jgi:hypothetical protein
VATRDTSNVGTPSITQTAIAGAKLGLSADSYKHRFLEPATAWVRFREDRPSAPEVRYFSRSIARRSSSFDMRERPLMPNLSA